MTRGLRYALAIWVLELLFVLQVCPAFGSLTPGATSALKTTHQIAEATITDHGSTCSATAIGPHAILTASHCEEPTDIIQVDDTDYKIVGIIRDSFDHTIYLLGGRAMFKDVAPTGTGSGQIGDDIFVVGNPGPYTRLFRRGVIAGKTSSQLSSWLVDNSGAILYDFNGFFGDSGAAIFNDNGEIIGVVSEVSGTARQPDSNEWPIGFKIMLGWPLHFTAAQLEQARNFVPKG